MSVDMTDEEIAKASGLPLSVVVGLSWATSWIGVAVDVMLAFSRACGVDFDDNKSLKRNWTFLNKGAGRHLLSSPRWKTLYQKLYAQWAVSNIAKP